MLTRALVAGAFLWPMLLASGWWVRTGGHAEAGWGALVYAAASHVCHQRPERSFQTAGAQWPVCGRCSGLYLAAPLGVVFGLVGRRPPRGSIENRRRVSVSPASETNRHPTSVLNRTWLVAGAIPTLVTIGLEWAGLPVSSAGRAAAALPLGAVVAAVLVRTAAGRTDAIK